MPRSYARLLFASVFALALVGCDSGGPASSDGNDADDEPMPDEATFEVRLSDGRSLSLSADLFADAEAFQLPDGTMMKRVFIYSDGDEAGFNAEVPFREGRHRLGTIYAEGTGERTVDNLNFTIGEDFYFSDPSLADESGGTYAEAFVEIVRADEDAVTGRIGGTFFNDDGSEVEAVSLTSGVFRIDQVFDEAPDVSDETEGAGEFPYDDGSDEGGDGGGDGGGEEDEELIADFEMLVQGPIFDGVYVRDVEFRFEDVSENAVEYEWFVAGDGPEFVERRFWTTPFPEDQVFQVASNVTADTASVTVTLRVTGADGETDEHSETAFFPTVRGFGSVTYDGVTTQLRTRDFGYMEDHFSVFGGEGNSAGVISVEICDGLGSDCPEALIHISPGPLLDVTSLRQSGDFYPESEGGRSFYVVIGSYETFDDPAGSNSSGSLFLDTILSDNDYGLPFVNLTLEATLRDRNDPDNEDLWRTFELEIQKLPNVCYVWPSSVFCRNQELP